MVTILLEQYCRATATEAKNRENNPQKTGIAHGLNYHFESQTARCRAQLQFELAPLMWQSKTSFAAQAGWWLGNSRDRSGAWPKSISGYHRAMKQEVIVAFLRGINVGGNAVIKMAELKGSFESLGFKKVVPVLASGNVLFESPVTDTAVLRHRLEEMLARKCKIQPVVILRTGSQILKLLKLQPFNNTTVTPQTRLHITFLAEYGKPPAKLSSELVTQGFQVTRISAGEICSVVEVSEKGGTPELMRLLEQQFGKNITTRTWNTIQKIGKLLGA
jgi:uncharacterized protein (DUF1697 family)